jgi:hypothetical protein
LTAHSFVLALVVASALLAFWFAARFPNAGPARLETGVLHLFCGFAAVRAIPGLTDAVTAAVGDLARLLVPFGIGLPLFTYAFLTGLWLVRLIQRSLHGRAL